jgi:hypothetical protein
MARAAVLPLFTLTILFVAGCSEDSVGPPPTPVEIEIITILCNPLAPAPSATATLTAQVTGQGGEAGFTWTVSGGTIVENGAITATWTVPSTPGIYSVSVVARIEAAADTMTRYILVRRFESIPTGIRYSFYPNLLEGELFFVGSTLSPTSNQFIGYHAYSYSFGSTIITTNPSPPIDGGAEFTFGPQGLLASVVTGGSEFLRQQPMNVIFFPLPFGSKWYVSNNDLLGTTFRKNQHVHPCGSPDMSMVVWQYIRVGDKDDGTQDRANISFRSGTSPIQRLTTSVDSTFVLGGWNYKYYRNIKPLFTPAMNYIVYFVDSTGTLEPCLMPLAGNVPLVDERRALMVDARRGIFYYAGVGVSRRTVFQWNPTASNQLFFIDGARKLCLLDIASESVEILAEKVSEFAFSDNGVLAMIRDEGVYVGAPGAEPELIFAKERDSDDIIGVSWSPGTSDQRIVFRVVRKGATVTEGFSAMVLYSFDDGRWYYATPRVPFGSEPAFDDYRWKRTVFEAFGGGFISPIPVSVSGTSGIALYWSY